MGFKSGAQNDLFSKKHAMPSVGDGLLGGRGVYGCHIIDAISFYCYHSGGKKTRNTGKNSLSVHHFKPFIILQQQDKFCNVITCYSVKKTA